MELQWRKLDHAIAAQPMPTQFERTRVQLQCNDCSAKSVGRYHWLGNKCGVCESYNTSELRVIEPDEDPDEARSPNAGVIVGPEPEPATQLEEGLEEMRDLSLRQPASATTTATTPSSPPAEVQPPERVDSANTSPRRPLQLRELRPSRSYFLNADDDDAAAAAAAAANGPPPQSSGIISVEAARNFLSYEMLQRVSRSLSPIRYYLDGLGDDVLGEGGLADELEIEDEDEDEDGDSEDDDEEDDEDGAVDEDHEGDEDSDNSMDAENGEFGDDDDDDDDEDDDEALDLPGHR